MIARWRCSGWSGLGVGGQCLEDGVSKLGSVWNMGVWELIVLGVDNILGAGGVCAGGVVLEASSCV